jgi:hypothetical protein
MNPKQPIIIKDLDNRTRGMIRTQGTVVRLTNANNRTVGTYNSATNVTYAGGKPIGLGNQLLRIRL